MNRSRSFGALIALGFTISFVMLIVIGAVGYFSIAKVWNNTHELGATYAVIDQLSELISALKDAETGQRGYLLTGDDTYLEPYRLADASIDDALKQLRDSTADDPVQARRLEQAVPLIQSKMAELKQTIELRRSQGLDAALKVVTTGQGKAYMDKIRQVVAEMDNQQRTSLHEEKTRTDFAAGFSETTIISASLLAFVLIGLIGWYLTSSLTRQIGSAAALLQNSSSQLQAAANLQSSGSTGQATAVNEIATTINELLSTSRLIAENAQRVAKVAQETSLTASRGDETVQRTTQSIAGIKTQVDVVVVHVLELGKKSQLIGSITEMINELAEQTNILAINATIEAAGAGEWGKRFAVVADEIRKLADRVSVSSSEIRQLLDNIRASASSTIAATQDGSKLVDAGVREFAEAAVLFRQIAALVSTASEAAREIELSTEQQASAVDQVRVGASDLVQTAHETDTSSKQVLKTSSELAGLSRELVMMVRSNGHVSATSH
ncbi:MAG: CHASE3 domain-containing protein [Candidatus Binatus sp.]|uniref:CHASE3 domain-containing protein n=1 Tax=Candidatus Binatus sp. TaxID=2811406 RepID=UPI003BB13A4C